jgi:hypothetical protein
MNSNIYYFVLKYQFEVVGLLGEPSSGFLTAKPLIHGQKQPP